MRWVFSAILLIPLCATAQTPFIQARQVTTAPLFEDFLSRRTAPEPATTDFIQRDPAEGQPASQPTHVFVLYDNRFLYLIFQCYDSEPAKIRARMSKRDDFYEDDLISVRLDTFHDRRRAYQFTSNPLGVQGDAMHDESVGADNTFDTLWYSRGRLTDWGYLVMMSIPWKSLRFPRQPEQTWGILFTRLIPRNNEICYWPAVTRQVRSYLAQAGELRGLENISPARNVQFIPYGSLLSSRYADLSTRQFVSKTADFSGGLDAKTVLHGNLALDLTLNPDFSQVESDEPQVTVNQRWEVFFPEKRPFFLENANYFRTPIQVFFSRRIADPQFGVRLTGKQGPWAIGALLSDDQAPGHTTDANFADRRAGFAVVRINRDISQDSTLGAVFTERRFAGSSNQVAGIDTRVKLPGQVYFTAQALAGVTHTRSGGQEQTVSAPAFYAALEHYGRHWTYYDKSSDYGASFRVDAGYVPRVDIRSNTFYLAYSFRPAGRRLVRWEPYTYNYRNWNHTGQRQDWTQQQGIVLEWRRQTFLSAAYSAARERFTGRDFNRRTWWLDFQTALSKRWSFHTLFRPGLQVVYQPAAGANPERYPECAANPTLACPFPARGIYSETGLTLRPVPRLRLDHTVLLTRLRDSATGGSVFTNAIFRQKINYQFTRALSLRTIIQYDSTVPNPALSALPRGKRLSGDILLSYILHPGTAIFLGYNHRLQNYDAALGSDASPNAPPFYTAALFPTSKQFFAKISYLYRF